MTHTRRSIAPLSVLLFLGLVATAATAWAQAASDALFRDFEPTGEMQLELNGSVADDIELYRSDRASAYLLIGPQLDSPLLVNIRSRRVEAVSFLKVRKMDDGSIDLLADTSFAPVGPFTLGERKLHFELRDGTKAVLAPKPPLLGFQTEKTLAEHNPAYQLKADAYEIDAEALTKLQRLQKNAKVRVYFGSWCPVCGRLVPRIMKLSHTLANPNLSFEYYGLPQPMSDDPIADEQEIHGVPTAILYVDDKEVGRLDGRHLAAPEKAFSAGFSD